MTRNEMKLNEIEERIKLFLENHTFTFIKIIKPNSEINIYNGYIKKNNEDVIIFTDVELGDIPIFKKELRKIDISYKKRENGRRTEREDT